MKSPSTTLLALALTLAACASSGDKVDPDVPPEELARQAGVEPDLPIAAPPYDEVAANWKQRVGEAYVFVEAETGYASFGGTLDQALELASAQGVVPAGPPFGLFFGGADLASGLFRACVPVAGPTQVDPPLHYDLLPGGVVVYGFVQGPYPSVADAYPPLFEFLAGMSWVPAGPVREIYLVAPGLVSDWSQLVTEIQIPAAPGGS